MRKIFVSLPSSILLAAVLCCSLVASPSGLSAQEGDLGIGSKAPSLDVERWLSVAGGKFKPVTDFEAGKVYVVEFWATWCPPCRASMPVLSKLQTEYGDSVQIISVSSEDNDTVDEFLESNVPSDESLTFAELTSTYCLTNDPDGSTDRDYMEASGQGGIPAAFIVGKTGLIEWTGHPMSMDKTLSEVVAGTWDREAFKAKIEVQQAAERAQRLAMQKVEKAMQKVDEQVDAGKFDEALGTLNAIVDNEEFEALKPQLVMIRSQVAMTLDGPVALKAFKDGIPLLKDFPDALNEVAWTMVELKDGGEKVGDEMLAAGLEAAEVADQQQPNDPGVLDTIAHLHFLIGNLDKAIAAQEKALANAAGSEDQIKPFLDLLKLEKAKETPTANADEIKVE